MGPTKGKPMAASFGLLGVQLYLSGLGSGHRTVGNTAKRLGQLAETVGDVRRGGCVAVGLAAA